MASDIKRLFDGLDIELNSQMAKQLETLVLQFEMGGENPLVLNSQLLGIRHVIFSSDTRKAIFDIFGVSEQKIFSLVEKIPAVRRNKKKPDEIAKVAGDPLNLLGVWIVHLSRINHTLKVEDRQKIEYSIIKLLYYRFFSSLCTNTFFADFLADERVMEQAVNKLSRKFSLITCGTWRKLIEARVEATLSTKGLHYVTFEKMDNDDAVLYIITDIRAHIADRIKNVFDVYDQTLKAGESISNYSTTTVIDGVKMVKDQVVVLDMMISGVCQDIFSYNSFYDASISHLVAGMFTSLNDEIVRAMLEKFVALAKEQSLTRDAVLTVSRKGQVETYIGTKILVENIIRKTYRKLTLENKLANVTEILNATKNTYSSSRITDQDILNIKDSVRAFVDKTRLSVREATRSSLTIAFIMYVMCRTVKYLK